MYISWLTQPPPKCYWVAPTQRHITSKGAGGNGDANWCENTKTDRQSENLLHLCFLEGCLHTAQHQESVDEVKTPCITGMAVKSFTPLTGWERLLGSWGVEMLETQCAQLADGKLPWHKSCGWLGVCWNKNDHSPSTQFQKSLLHHMPPPPPQSNHRSSEAGQVSATRPRRGGGGGAGGSAHRLYPRCRQVAPGNGQGCAGLSRAAVIAKYDLARTQ